MSHILYWKLEQSCWEPFWQFLGMLTHFRSVGSCLLFPSRLRVVYRSVSLGLVCTLAWTMMEIVAHPGKEQSRITGSTARAAVTSAVDKSRKQ